RSRRAERDAVSGPVRGAAAASEAARVRTRDAKAEGQARALAQRQRLLPADPGRTPERARPSLPVAQSPPAAAPPQAQPRPFRPASEQPRLRGIAPRGGLHACSRGAAPFRTSFASLR